MSFSAIVFMLLSIITLWGGFGYCLSIAMKKE